MRKEAEMYTIIDEKNKGKKQETKLSAMMTKRNMGTVVLADKTKLEYGQISNYKSGKQSNMMLDTAKKICNALGTSLDETFGDGQVDFKTKILADINSEIKKLDGRDAEGHLWYNKFKEMILGVESVSVDNK